jgi:outer membrane cobalamin receptor
LYVFDGITLNTGGSGDVGSLLGQLDPSMVQSIEVLRGPRATTYGANSTSGVIDFTTLAGDHPEADLSLEGGSLDWRKVRVGLQDQQSLGAGTLSTSLNGSYLHSGGLHQYEYTRNGTVVGRTTWQTERLEIGGSFYLADNQFQSAFLSESIQDAPPPYFALQLADPANVDRTKAGIVSLWFQQQLAEHLSQKLTIGGAGQDVKVDAGTVPNGGLLGSYISPYDGWIDPNSYSPYPAGATIPVYQYPYTYRTINNNGEADYNLRYRADSVSAVLGATYLGQHYNETYTYGGFPSGSSESQSTRSVYADAALDWLDKTLHTSLGARLDSYSAWRNKGTYSVGVAYDIARLFTVYANYGTSFTQPTLDQLYNPLEGNKSLTPENGSTIEGGIRGRQLAGALTESATFWHSYINNVIQYDPTIFNPRIVDGLPYGEYANAAAARSQGVEVEAAYKITPHLAVNGNYTYTDSHLKDLAGAWQLSIENARNMGNLGLTWTATAFDAGTNLYATDRRLRWAGDFRAPGYARLDLFGRYHVTAHFDLYARVQNALDHHIVEVLGYRNPGVYCVAGGTLRLY